MLLHDSSSLKDPCMPTPWHLCKTPSARPLAKEHAQLVAAAALFCTVSSRFSVAPHFQAINHGFRVKLDHKNVSYYGPLRRTIEAAKADLGRATEVPGHAEQVKILIALQKETGNAHAKRSIGRLQQGEQPQGAKNSPKCMARINNRSLQEKREQVAEVWWAAGCRATVRAFIRLLQFL